MQPPQPRMDPTAALEGGGAFLGAVAGSAAQPWGCSHFLLPLLQRDLTLLLSTA